MKLIKKTTKNLTEAVRNDRTYEYDIVSEEVAKVLEQHGYKIVTDSTETDLDNKIINYYDIEDDFEIYSKENGAEIYAEDVDNAVSRLTREFGLTPEEVNQIENAINNSYGNGSENRKSDFDDDIATLEDLLKEDSSIRLYSSVVRSKLYDLIAELKSMEYTGLER